MKSLDLQLINSQHDTFNARDTQILLTLITPMTSMELCNELHLSYSHGITLLRTLVTKDFVHRLPKNTQHKIFYTTARTPETEPIFTLKDENNSGSSGSTPVGKATLIRIPWEGRLLTLLEIGQILIKRKRNSNRLNQDLATVCVAFLHKLRYDSHSPEKELTPTAMQLREALRTWIGLEERNLKFAKTVLEANIWEGRKGVHWKLTHEEITSEEYKNLEQGAAKIHKLAQENQLLTRDPATRQPKALDWEV